MLKGLEKNDTTLTPYVATKNWNLSNIANTDLVLAENGNPVAVESVLYTFTTATPFSSCSVALEQQSQDLVRFKEGLKITGLFYPDDPINVDGTYKRLVHAQVATMFYNHFRDPTQIWGTEKIDFDTSETKRFLSDLIKLLDIPTDIFGDKIVEGSVQIIDDTLDNPTIIKDDGNNNLFAGPNLFSKQQELGQHPNLFQTGSDSTCVNYFSFGAPLSPSLTASLLASTEFSYSDMQSWRRLLPTTVSYDLNTSSFVVSSHTLPDARGSMVEAVVGNKIYLYGGRTLGSSPQNNIYTASVDSPEIVGDTGTTLPSGMGWNAGRILIIGGTMYWYGGANASNTVSNTIYTASISNPLVWGNSGQTIPSATAEQSMFITNNTIYLAWGFPPGGFGITNTIYTASVNSPMTFGLGGTTSFSASQMSVMQIGQKLIALGGNSNANPSTFIYTASRSDPYHWYSSSTSIPGGSPNMSIAVGSKHYVLGGFIGAGNESAEIFYFNSILPTQSIDTGTTTGQINFSNSNLILTMSNGTPYLVMYGGSDGSSTVGRNTIITASVIQVPLSSSIFSASLNWTEISTNVDGFVLEKSTNTGSSWSTLSIFANNVFSSSDSPIVTNIYYSYRMYAFNTYGNSAYSNTASVLGI